MSYATVVAGVLATARTSTRLSTAKVAYEDYQVLNQGNGAALIVKCTGFSQERNAFSGEHWCDWRFDLVQHSPFGDLPASIAARDLDRDALLNAFRKYPQLGGVPTVHEANISGGTPSAEPQTIGNVAFLVDIYTLVVREDVSGSELE